MSHCSDHSPQASPAAGGPRPDWCDPAQVVLDLDVTALLATGEHPLERVKLAVAQCAPGQVVQLTSSFQPAPAAGPVHRRRHAGVVRPGRPPVPHLHRQGLT